MKSKLLTLLTLCVLLLTLAPSNARAGGVTSLKGFVANDPPTVNLLAPAWIQTDFGTYLMNYNFGATRLVLNMTNLTALPSPADLLLLTTHPNYERWWIIGVNEPDINNYTPQEVADKITAQGNAILAVAPNARLTIASLSQAKPLYKREYFWKIWALLPANIQHKVRAINIHFYTQFDGLPDSETFSAQPIIDHLDATRAAMLTHGVDDRKLFVTEIGIAKTTYTNAHLDLVANYPNVIAEAMNGRADRWAIYPQFEWGVGASYHGLMPASPYPSLAAQGQVFRDIQ